MRREKRRERERKPEITSRVRHKQNGLSFIIIIIIIIIIVHLRIQPEGCGAAIYTFWAPGPDRIPVFPVSSLAVLRGPPLLSLGFYLQINLWCVFPGVQWLKNRG